MRNLLTLLITCFCLIAFPIANAATPKNWTFIIYINGDNSLDRFGAQNIKAMEKVGSDDQVNIVVQWASYSAGKSVRMLVQKSTDPNSVTSPIIQDLGFVDMGDYHSLEDFIQWSVEHYPAQHYFVDVWNHGSGWHYSKLSSWKKKMSFSLPDISYDDITDHVITTEQLGEAMNYAAKIIGHKVDLYGSDACLMAMAEVANEMSNSVDYFAGSQDLEPGAGWPYAELLSRWTAIPEATPEQVAKILTEEYVKSYQGGSNGTAEVTFSAFNLNQMDVLNKSIAKLSADVRQLNTEGLKNVLSSARSAKAFYGSDYVDLIDFAKQLAASGVQGVNSQDILDVQNAANQFIIANAGTTSYEKATGLSIWIPPYRWSYDSKAERYQHLRFNVETQWGDALRSMLQSEDRA